MSVSDPGEKIEWGADSEPRKNERVPSSDICSPFCLLITLHMLEFFFCLINSTLEETMEERHSEVGIEKLLWKEKVQCAISSV
jgi:hypothetical protein